MENYNDVLVALRRISRATDLHSKHLSKTSGLTMPQLLILQAIEKFGGTGVSTIAREVNLSQATVTTILDRLEKRGLIQRLRSGQDKRRVNVLLTEEGRNMTRHSPTPLQEHFIERFQELPEWEQTLVLSTLQRVAQMMDEKTIKTAPQEIGLYSGIGDSASSNANQ